MFRWTEPYCGVTHLITPQCAWRFSVEDYGKFADAKVYTLASADSVEVMFTRLDRKDETYIADAKAWLEEQAILRNIPRPKSDREPTSLLVVDGDSPVSEGGRIPAPASFDLWSDL